MKMLNALAPTLVWTTGGCAPSALERAGARVDPMTDLEHCGGYDAPCEPGDICELGACVVACEPNRSVCRGVCVDITADPTHCGGCDIACDPGLSCQDSGCDELEVCDGVDNDADRSVDEGFPDGVPMMVPVDRTCVSPDVVIEDPRNAVIEHQYRDPTFGSGSAPVVGQLTDDNMDGAIATGLPQRIVALEPGMDTVHWSVPGGADATASTLIADVNADGRNEVVTSRSRPSVSTAWSSASSATNSAGRASSNVQSRTTRPPGPATRADPGVCSEPPYSASWTAICPCE